MSEGDLHTFDDRSDLEEALEKLVVDQLAEGIRARGMAMLAISGGSTPRALLTRLAGAALAWDKVFVTLVDERWVDPRHEDSNERMVREVLLSGPAAAARFISLSTDDAHPSAALEEIEDRLQLFDTFDCVLLGMGADGHFASLFPGAEALREGLDLSVDRACIAVVPPEAPYPRMSMTLRRIVDTRRLILHITGDEKLAVLGRARELHDPDELPIAAVLEVTQPAVQIYWAP
jgi:6-phosphogluconolactonase